MTFEEYSKDRKSKFGRKKGSIYSFTIRDVYDSLKDSGDVSVGFKLFRKILYRLGTKVWDSVYDGKVVAIPYLFNMEIVNSNFHWIKNVDWKRTHKLWAEDEEAFKDRLLVRHQPSRFFVRVKHTTRTRDRSKWYYPSILDIKVSRKRQREIESRYKLA
jgi:hypothetical protein